MTHRPETVGGEVFQDIQGIKKRLRLNIEFARPEHFVPPLAGTDGRHVFIDRVGDVDSSGASDEAPGLGEIPVS